MSFSISRSRGAEENCGPTGASSLGIDAFTLDFKFQNVQIKPLDLKFLIPTHTMARIEYLMGVLETHMASFEFRQELKEECRLV